MLSRARFPQLSVQFSVQSEITALAGKTYRHSAKVIVTVFTVETYRHSGGEFSHNTVFQLAFRFIEENKGFGALIKWLNDLRQEGSSGSNSLVIPLFLPSQNPSLSPLGLFR